MRISFGNSQYDSYTTKIKQIRDNTVKFNDAMYNIADPPVNVLLRYEIKPNIIPNDKIRNSINTINRTQAEFYSMVYNPLYIPNKVVHYNQTYNDTKNLINMTKNKFNFQTNINN